MVIGKLLADGASNSQRTVRAGKVREAEQALTAYTCGIILPMWHNALSCLSCSVFPANFTRAERQLAVLAARKRGEETGAIVYYAALHAEKTRHDLFEKRNFRSMLRFCRLAS